jgi:hypothetical protein
LSGPLSIQRSRSRHRTPAASARPVIRQAPTGTTRGAHGPHGWESLRAPCAGWRLPLQRRPAGWLRTAPGQETGARRRHLNRRRASRLRPRLRRHVLTITCLRHAYPTPPITLRRRAIRCRRGTLRRQPRPHPGHPCKIGSAYFRGRNSRTPRTGWSHYGCLIGRRLQLLPRSGLLRGRHRPHPRRRSRSMKRSARLSGRPHRSRASMTRGALLCRPMPPGLHGPIRATSRCRAHIRKTRFRLRQIGKRWSKEGG